MWIEAEPDFRAQPVYLVERHYGFDEQDLETWQQECAPLKAQGVNDTAPSMNMLATPKDDDYTTSAYAKAVHAAGGWYCCSVTYYAKCRRQD